MTLGTDFSGTTDIDPALREVTGRRALGQAVVRRLNTPRGQLQDHPDYGYDLGSIIGTTVSINTITQRVLEQCLLEEEVEDADVDVVTDGESVVQVNIKITDGLGPFLLTLNINDVEVTAIIPEE